MSKERLIELSWILLEYKYMYYYIERVLKKYLKDLPHDLEYDAQEREYDKLCIKYNHPNKIKDMPGWNNSSPSAKLVQIKLSKKEWKRHNNERDKV